MEFLHIAPTPHLSDFCEQQTHHLLLAHLVESDPVYTGWYTKNRGLNTYILDNSAFEMYKQGREMYPADNLIAMGQKVNANYVVLPDYPNKPAIETVQAAIALAPKFRNANLGTFFVPQSEIGNVEDYISAFAWAASSPLVDYIGVSILGVPNAYGVERENKLQRFNSRWAMMCELERRNLLTLATVNGKKIHFLGMVDGPNEISLVHPRFKIDTWDSSAAVWAGLRGIAFDKSPTGLINGKYEEEVDFNFKSNDTNDVIRAKQNQRYINDLTKVQLPNVKDLLGNLGLTR